MTFLFGLFELDASACKLRRDGVEVALQPKVFDAIRYLIEHRDRVVYKEELLEALWSGEHVNETAVPWTLSRARKALGQGVSDKNPIETVRGRGYRFVGAVRVGRSSDAPPSGSRVQMVAAPAYGGGRPVPSDPFVGRGDAMERLIDALHGAVGGRGRLCLLTGDAGIGKTRCVSELGAMARRRKLGVWTGRCLEGGRTAAFWPWVQVLRDAQREGALSPTLQGELSALLADLIPGRDAAEPAIDVGGASSARVARFWILEKLSRLLLHSADAAPRAILLEDVHWADDASLDLLVFLAAELSQVGLLVVATARNASPAHEAWTKASSRLGPCERIELLGLKPAEVEQYVAEATLLQLSDDIHRTVYAKCGGNPLFLQETARLLIACSDRGEIGALQAQDIPVPGVARDVLRGRLTGLGAEACEVLDVACVIGQELDLPVLQSVLGIGAEALLARLDEAVQARLIAPRSRVSSFGFTHDTIREALYEELSSARRVELHHRVGEAIEGRDVGDRSVSDLAYHYYRALPRADAARVERHACAAGKLAMRGFAYEEAAQYYGWALEAQRFRGEPYARSRCELLLSFATAVRLSGRSGASRKAIAQAIAIAREHGFADLLWEAAGGLRPTVLSALVPDKLALEALEDANKLLSSDQRPLRIRVLSKLACIPPSSLSTAKSEALSARAVELAEASGDPGDMAVALTSRLHVLSGPDHIAELLDVTAEIVRLDPRAAAEIELTRYHAFLHKGDMAAAADSLETYGRVVRALRRPESLWHYQRLSAQNAQQRGDFEQAESLFHDLIVQSRRLRLRYGEMHYVMHSVATAYERTGLAAASSLAWRSELEWATGIPSFRAHWVRFLVESGRTDDARTALQAMTKDGLETITKDIGYLNALSHLSVAAAALEEEGIAERLYALLRPYPHHNTPNGFGYYLGSVSHFLGLLAMSLDRTQDALGHLDDAVTMNGRMGSAPLLARSQVALAEVLLGRGRSGHARATALLDEASASATRLEMAPLSSQIAAMRVRAEAVPARDAARIGKAR